MNLNEKPVEEGKKKKIKKFTVSISHSFCPQSPASPPPPQI